MIFDSEWMSGITAAVAPSANLASFDIKWRTPLSEIGYLVVANLRSKGVEGISRKQNIKAAMNFLKQHKPI